MAEWIVERGIGETRWALVDDGKIVEARIELDGVAAVGTIVEARLASIGHDGRNAIARDGNNSEYLIPQAPRGITEGAAIAIEVTRSAIPGAEPWKRPLARLGDEIAAQADLTSGVRVLSLPSPQRDELGDAGWNDLIEEARSSRVDFAGGSLGLFVTPAMTLIDVDGILPPGELAIAGAAAAARAIRRLDIGGSIGVDLPTTRGKQARQAADAAIDAHLPQPLERTGVNGFGFVQIVRPRLRASLLEIWSERASAEARALLRRACFETPGDKNLVAHPAVITVLERNPDWLAVLARQVGGAVGLRPDPSLTMSGGHAERR